MRVRWKDFELPTRVVRDEEISTDTYARFVAEPFERGYGTTVGNSLRRILLSSIEGSAVTSLKIQGVKHEFSTIGGVYEDVPDIILNVKQLLVKMHRDGTTKLWLKAKKKGEVTAEDIVGDESVEVVNKDLHIATLTNKVELNIEMEVRKGRGYKTAEENRPTDAEIGLIPIDSSFSPVRRVQFRTEDTRVGKVTNYDRLIMDVWTDGTVKPEEALVEAAKILRKHLNPFVQYYEAGRELKLEDTREEESRKREKLRVELAQKLQQPMSVLDLSVRASNCLDAASVKTIGDLVKLGESDLLRLRNFGKTSLKEVKKKLEDMEVSLGMDLSVLESEAE
jgi:DNA-directed RNA polymerase subunit alpha